MTAARHVLRATFEVLGAGSRTSARGEVREVGEEHPPAVLAGTSIDAEERLHCVLESRRRQADVGVEDRDAGSLAPLAEASSTRVLYERLARKDRPAWALAVLDACYAGQVNIPPEVENVREIARAPNSGSARSAAETFIATSYATRETSQSDRRRCSSSGMAAR
jgi:hypothetical protein